MAREPRATQRSGVGKPRPARPKLDARLALLLSLPDRQRRALKAEEDARLAKLSEEINEAVVAFDQAEDKDCERSVERLRMLDHQLFAPLTTGLFIPSERTRAKQWPIRMNEPFAAVFILSDASADDLKRLRVRVRSQVGDIFSAFIPLSAISELEESAAIRYIELARPLFRTLNQAVPYAQINTLHNAVPAVNGTGVVVGIVDSRLDIFHPDFRTAANATRVLFLWDQTLTPQGTEAGPPVAPALPGFTPAGGVTYGVEYNQATINNELNSFNPPATPAYQTVRHGGTVAEHGTHVAGIAAGNGLGQGGTFTGAASGSNIIFVRQAGAAGTALFGDSVGMADAFAYIFARAAQLGQACVINMSASDNQGPHDGMTLGEQFLDNLLLTPGRAITLSAGNSNNTGSHAAGNVPPGGTSNLALNYVTADLNGDGVNDVPRSDAVEIWYDGHDRFAVTVTVPAVPATIIGPVNPGNVANAVLPNGVNIQVTSVLNDPRNGDNLISIIFTVPGGQTIPAGNTTIALTGTTVVNGAFQAWVDRNNRGFSAFQAPFLQEGTVTLGVPATARRPITVGNHNKVAPTPAISGSSGRGASRDARIKPEIATVGTGVTAPRSRDMNAAALGALYVPMSGTSMSAPLVAGACACLFQCRGGASTWANLKQILEDTAGTVGFAIPGNDFGFGFMQVGTGCAAPAPSVDVWLRDDATDTGSEPFTGPVAWLSPDIEVLDVAGNPVANPTYDPVKRFNNIIRVTVRNRGTSMARNTEVYFCWADPATNIPYPAAWNTTGIYNDTPGFVNQSNMIVIPQLAAGASTQVQFGWAPPAPGSNIRGDDHFCLLVRLENEGDPSQIGAGGWSAISAHNNIGLHNVHVQPDDPNDADMSFYVVGSADQDSLIVYPRLAGGELSLLFPVQVLPWRNITLIERNKGPRPGFGYSGAIDPLAHAKATLKGDRVRVITDIVGAELLELRDGIARVTMGKADRLHVPYMRLADGARMVARIHVDRPKIDKERRFVHVAQHSGGQLIGGVSLELRPRRK
jgi:subtilisin family serine protease